MKVLVGCEYSGRVREAFRKRGHAAISCDLLPAEDGSPNHYQGDVFHMLDTHQWDLVILHPPCTRLTVSGQWYVKRSPAAQVEQEQAIAFTERLWFYAMLRSKAVVVENPVGILSTQSMMGKPTQIIQPYDFGEDASKKTCLWLCNAPPLEPTKRIPGRLVTLPSGKTVERWSNQTDSGQNRLPPSPDRWKERSRTYQGIADAMAEQWGNLSTFNQIAA